MTSFLVYMSGRVGRAIRVVFGLALITTGFGLGGAWVALGLFGFLPLATGVFGICPIAPLKGLPLTARALRNVSCP